MRELVERIKQEGKNLGGGILKVDGFINHRLEPGLTLRMGRAFADRFAEAGVREVSKVITAEVSGIAPAFATAAALDVPLLYARKKRPLTMSRGVYEAEAPSRTKGGVTKLIVSPEYLNEEDRVLLIDDFLASGQTLEALIGLIHQCGARLVGIGCVIEKRFEGGRERLEKFRVPIISLAVVIGMDEGGIEVEGAD